MWVNTSDSFPWLSTALYLTSYLPAVVVSTVLTDSSPFTEITSARTLVPSVASLSSSWSAAVTSDTGSTVSPTFTVVSGWAFLEASVGFSFVTAILYLPKRLGGEEGPLWLIISSLFSPSWNSAFSFIINVIVWTDTPFSTDLIVALSAFLTIDHPFWLCSKATSVVDVAPLLV